MKSLCFGSLQRNYSYCLVEFAAIELAVFHVNILEMKNQ